MKKESTLKKKNLVQNVGCRLYLRWCPDLPGAGAKRQSPKGRYAGTVAETRTRCPRREFSPGKAGEPHHECCCHIFFCRRSTAGTALQALLIRFNFGQPFLMILGGYLIRARNPIFLDVCYPGAQNGSGPMPGKTILDLHPPADNDERRFMPGK